MIENNLKNRSGQSPFRTIDSSEILPFMKHNNKNLRKLKF